MLKMNRNSPRFKHLPTFLYHLVVHQFFLLMSFCFSSAFVKILLGIKMSLEAKRHSAPEAINSNAPPEEADDGTGEGR